MKDMRRVIFPFRILFAVIRDGTTETCRIKRHVWSGDALQESSSPKRRAAHRLMGARTSWHPSDQGRDPARHSMVPDIGYPGDADAIYS
jgi:hypothetical protein